MARLVCAAIVAVALLSGCAATRAPPAQGEASFPEISHAWRDEGMFVNVDERLQMNMGLTKEQVRHLLGGRHFQEGFFGVHTWNYIFNFRTGSAPDDYVTCQYQVHFDGDMLTDGLYWRDSQCPPFLQKKTETIALSGDVLFA